MPISRVREELAHTRILWQYTLRPRLARVGLGTWFLLGVAVLVASLVFGGLFALFPYADPQSIRSALGIIASTAATFVGFTIVALALLAGRAGDAREHLGSVMPRYKDVNKFHRVHSDYLQALSPDSLNDQPMLGPYPLRSIYTHREIYTALESIYRMVSFPLVGPVGVHDLVMRLDQWGFSSREIHDIFESSRIFERQPHEFFKALRKVLELERAHVGPSSDYLPSSNTLTALREKWESDRISANLDRVERHQRATGGRFWAAMVSSIIALIGSVLLTLGSTDMMLQCVLVRMSFIGMVITWSIAIFLIIAYLTQLL